MGTMTAGLGALDLASVRALSNINDVNRLLHEANTKERSIDAELEQLLSRRGQLEDSLLTLHDATTEVLQVMRADAEGLAASTADTAALAEKVSRKVRQLDLAQSRVAATLERIGLVVDRQRAIEGIQAALAAEDYEGAGECVARYLELEDLFGGALAEGDARQAQEQARVLREGQAQLEQIVRSRAREAAAANDHPSVLRFVRLFKPLRLQQEGMEVLLGYLRGLISERAKADHDALVDSAALAGDKGRADYLGTLTNLFKDVAAALDEHLELIREVFGSELGLTAVVGLHAECDVHGTRVLQRYMDHRQLPRIAGQIGMRKRNDTTAAEAPVDPRQVEAFLEEILLLCQRSEEYTTYLLARMGDVVAPEALPPSKETHIRGGSFNSAVRELLSYYLSLEEYYMEETVTKAIRLDEGADGSLTSSMVDDVFFVLLKAGRRAMGTGKAPSVVAILNQLNSLLASQYRAALAAKLQGAPGKLAASAPAEEGAAPGAAAAPAALAFNNADVSSGYVSKLREQLEGLAMQLFMAANDRDRIKMVLADLSKTASDLKALTTKSLDQLCGGLMPRLRQVLDPVGEASYELAETDYHAGGTWPTALLVALHAHLRWLQPLLTPGCFDSLVHLVLDKVVSRLEATLAQKRFNQLGGLQLEKDVRTLVGGLSELTTRTVRDKFARLSQMATILSLEAVHEMLDFWGDNSGAIAWRLTEGDVRAILSQRVDFSRAEIQALRL